MKDFIAITDKAPTLPMSWEALEARARAEGVWDGLMQAGVVAGTDGASAALVNSTLPGWAQDVVRGQFPAAPPR